MILGEVEETVTVVEIDDETYEETSRSTKRAVPFLVRPSAVPSLCSVQTD
jgi:hypothetical protein